MLVSADKEAIKDAIKQYNECFHVGTMMMARTNMWMVLSCPVYCQKGGNICSRIEAEQVERLATNFAFPDTIGFTEAGGF